MRFTRPFRRLPPDAAIQFAGFESARIPSRQEVFVKIREFLTYCTKFAHSTAVRVILGEWGEGKSEAFSRYIKPQAENNQHVAISIDAKAISNSYKFVESLSPVPADQFLGALFYAVRSQDRNATTPARERYVDLADWLSEFLNNITKSNKHKVFLFIDEFEDLILDPDGLRKIVSGIKAVINGQYQPIAEGGAYEGSLFLFLSCTPDAYNNIRNDPEFAQVFGSYDRRLDIINLQPISRTEGLKFLWDILLYAYDQQLPDPLPISSMGVLSTLHTIAKGNIGALVSLATRLLTKAKMPDHNVRILDYQFLLEALPNEQISILGSSWRCLEKGYFDSLIHHLDGAGVSHEFQKVLKLLVGELTSFSVQDVSTRTNISQQMVQPVITAINAGLQQMGIPHAIISSAPIDETWHWNNILGEFLNDGRLHLGDYQGDLETFLRQTELLVLDGTQLNTVRCFPIDLQSILSSIQGVTVEEAQSIESRLPTTASRAPLYSLSQDVVSQLYPTPAPPALDYVKDRESKAQVWRKVSITFEETFKHLGVLPFIKSLEWCKELPFEITDVDVANAAVYFHLRDPQRGVTLNCCAVACLGNLTGLALENVERAIAKQTSAIHSVWVFHTGEQVSPEVDERHFASLWDRLLIIYSHPTLTKRIMAAYLLSQSKPKEISQTFFARAIRNLVLGELRIQAKWEKWMEHAAQKGIALRDLTRSSARTEKELADAMKFYLNCVGETISPEDTYNRNVELRRLTLFDTKIGLIPDIESPDQLQRITNDLQANGFIKFEPDKITIATTPPERKILSLLRSDSQTPLSTVRDQFLIFASNKGIVEQFYLPLLEFKGHIQRTKAGYALLDKNRALRTLTERVDRFRRWAEAQRKRSTDAHTYVTKRRENRLITLITFDRCLSAEYAKITDAQPDDFIRAKIRLINMLLDVFDEDLKPKWEIAEKKLSEIRDQTTVVGTAAVEDVTNLRIEFERWVRLTFENDQLTEYKAILKGLAEIKNILDSDVSKDSETLESKVPAEEFYFSKPDSTFNIKLYLSTAQLTQLDLLAKNLHQEASQIEALTADLKDGLASIHSSLRTLVIPKELALSHSLKTFIAECAKSTRFESVSQPATQWEYDISLMEIAAEIRKNRKRADDLIPTLTSMLSILRRTLQSEQRLVDMLTEAHKQLDYARKTIDKTPFTEEVAKISNALAKLEEDYEELATQRPMTQDGMAPDLPTFAQVANDLDSLVAKVPERSGQLIEIWEAFKQELERELLYLQKAVALLPRSMDKEQMESRAADLLSRLCKSSYAMTARRMSDYYAMFQEVREQFKSVLGTFLNPTEIIVFSALTAPGSTPSTWVERNVLAEQVHRSTALSLEDCYRTFDSLADKHLLIPGVRLAT